MQHTGLLLPKLYTSAVAADCKYALRRLGLVRESAMVLPTFGFSFSCSTPASRHLFIFSLGFGQGLNYHNYCLVTECISVVCISTARSVKVLLWYGRIRTSRVSECIAGEYMKCISLESTSAVRVRECISVDALVSI